MKVRAFCALAAVAALAVAAQAQSAVKATAPGSDQERFIGAWRLVSLQSPGADGKVASVPGLKGTLIYTRDGHMSVQVMYPDSTLTNDYVLHGYEASFGSYEVDEATHTVTHHVQGSITRALVGKTLLRVYRFTEDRRLIITSARPDEHWSAIWRHY